MSLFSELETLGELMADNLEQQGVTADASDGLTTLANKILTIPAGSCYHIEFSQSEYTAVGGSVTVEVFLQENYQAKANASVTFTVGGSQYQSITNSEGIAQYTFTNLNSDVTFTASYSNATATASIIVQTYLFYDAGVTGNYNSNYTKSANGVNAVVGANGTTVSATTYSDCYYYENVLITGDFVAEATIVDIHAYGGLAFLNSSKSRQWAVECNLDGGKGWGWNGDSNIIDPSLTLPRQLKVERVGTTLKIYLDNVLTSTQTVTGVDGYLGWKTHSHSNRSITFKDFSIQSI